MADTLLDVRGLCVRYANAPGDAVKDVSFTLGRERLGIVGESGSGKSTMGRALMQLLPGARIRADRMDFMGRNLLSLNEAGMRKLRGSQISMILQDPKYSLNPIHRVGDQIPETLIRHFPVSKSEARRKSQAMLKAVRIRDPERVYDLYPHEVSGGMGQRIMIAMMLLADPRIVIADEPTSALGVTVWLSVLNLLEDLVKERGIGLIIISHDLNLVRNHCDRVIVMFGGRVVETLPAQDLNNASHPYTRGLMAAQPRIGGPRTPLPVLDRDAQWSQEILS